MAGETKVLFLSVSVQESQQRNSRFRIELADHRKANRNKPKPTLSFILISKVCEERNASICRLMLNIAETLNILTYYYIICPNLNFAKYSVMCPSMMTNV